MDWSRVKTILIFMFIFLNLFLIYNIVKQETNIVVISQDEVSDIKNILRNDQIEVNCSIPTTIRPKAFLKIEDSAYNEKDIVDNFFKGIQITIKIDKVDNKTIYKAGNESIEFYPDKSITYKNDDPKDNLSGFSKGKVIDYVEKFLKSHNISTKYAVLEDFKSVNGVYNLKYKEEYQGNQIFGSCINIEVSKNGVSQLKYFWVTPVQIVETPKKIKTPIDILMIFAHDNANSSKISINDITLGYYFPLKDFNNAAVSAVPAWRIVTSNNETFYYNAYEGYLESKES